jgi:NCS2 family nucleobase:cation symporter-2
MKPDPASAVAPVDEILSPPKLAALGFQHVLAMYAGAVAVPLIIGRALQLSPEHVALLINADLFGCGIATLIQSFGLGRLFGIRLPVMMGVTFAAVGPMLAMGNDPHLGILGIFGAVIAAGVFTILVAPVMGYFLPLFPPLVTGSVILMIGISLMRIGVNWAAGAMIPTLPGYGDPFNLGMSAFVLVCILVCTRFGTGFIRNIAVLLAIVTGCIVAWALGHMSFAKVIAAPWFSLIYPFQFGMPKFEIVSIITMCIVMIVVMIESAGLFLALSDMTGKKIEPADMTRGMRADGLGTLIGGVFNTFPYTSFSQNVGLVGVTGIKSRYVCVAGGVILIAMGLVPKLGALVEAVPLFVLGGAGIVMFGMVAATGIRILVNVDYQTGRNNLYVVAISIGFGMIPLVAPTFFAQLPSKLGPILNSGILLTTITAVLLNLYFNGTGKTRSRSASPEIDTKISAQASAR